MCHFLVVRFCFPSLANQCIDEPGAKQQEQLRRKFIRVWVLPDDSPNSNIYLSGPQEKGKSPPAGDIASLLPPPLSLQLKSSGKCIYC